MPDSGPSGKGRWLKLAVLVAIAAVAIALIASGSLDSLRDREQLEEFFNDSGAWGPLLFILAFVAAQPLSLPGAALIVPATFVWPWYEVFAYSLLGGMLASSIGFAMARWIGQDWVRARLPARLETWDRRLAERGFVATIGLRLVTGYAPAADWLLGVSEVKWKPFLAGTALGLMPTTLLLSLWGDDAIRSIGNAPFALTAVVIAVGLVAVLLLARRSRATKEA